MKTELLLESVAIFHALQCYSLINDLVQFIGCIKCKTCIMLPVAADDLIVALCGNRQQHSLVPVKVFISLSACHAVALCKNGWRDQGPTWGGAKTHFSTLALCMHSYKANIRQVLAVVFALLEYEGRTFIEFLKSKQLTDTVRHYVQHAISMVTDETSVTEVMLIAHWQCCIAYVVLSTNISCSD